jgi:hypothetical protein
MALQVSIFCLRRIIEDVLLNASQQAGVTIKQAVYIASCLVE